MVTGILRPVLNTATPFIVSLLSIASLGGVTLLLSCLQDILSVLTLHLRCCSLITTRICRWQLDSLGGLWNLFRGGLSYRLTESTANSNLLALRQTLERASRANRLICVRCRSTLSRDTPLHRVDIPPPHCSHIFGTLRICKQGCGLSRLRAANSTTNRSRSELRAFKLRFES